MMRDIKWALALLLLLLLALLASIPMALAADPYAGYTRVKITTSGDVLLWNDLKDAISNAQDPTYITIDKNIWLSGDRFSLYFVSGKDIVIDMQGHYLQTLNVDRNTSYSAVFNVEKGAKLKLINGGIRRISYRLDAQAIRNYGDMTLENWVIDDISSPSSGGAIQNNGTMVIRGGIITNCHARLWSDGSGKQNGGAICNNAGATLTIDGTEIKGNDSQLNGGAIYNEGTLTITGKTNIHENNAGQSGGGIYLADKAGARLYLNGGMIQNNSCGTDGGGVYVPEKAPDCQASATEGRKKTSLGANQPKHLRGRELTRSTTYCNCSSVTARKSQPLGKKKRSKPLTFSLEPRCQGACGLAKKTGALRASSTFLNQANSVPLSRETL